jgi:hypothetical protein
VKWIYTGFVFTPVVAINIPWDFFSEKQLPSQPVCSVLFSGSCYLSVAEGFFITSPYPAVAFF